MHGCHTGLFTGVAVTSMGRARIEMDDTQTDADTHVQASARINKTGTFIMIETCRPILTAISNPYSPSTSQIST
jgi:hypothetical protein